MIVNDPPTVRPRVLLLAFIVFAAIAAYGIHVVRSASVNGDDAEVVPAMAPP